MLEQQISALTAAVVALTAALQGRVTADKAASATAPDPASESGANKSSGKGTVTKGTPVVTGPSAAEKAANKQTKDKAAEPAAEAAGAAGMTEKDLTAVIIKTVAATSRDQVIALLTEQFGVKAGKEITDPSKRAEVRDALEALAAEASVG